VHLAGFIIRIYHDARSSDSQKHDHICLTRLICLKTAKGVVSVGSND